MTTPIDVSDCLRAGLFEQALGLFEHATHLSNIDRVNRLEALHYCGETPMAVKEANVLIGGQKLSALEISRCSSVLGDERWYSGDHTLPSLFTVRLSLSPKKLKTLGRSVWPAR